MGPPDLIHDFKAAETQKLWKVNEAYVKKICWTSPIIFCPVFNILELFALHNTSLWIFCSTNTKKFVIQNCKNTKFSDMWWYCYDCYVKTFNWSCSIIFWGLFRSSQGTLSLLRCCDNPNLYKTNLSFIKTIFVALSGSLSTISYLVWHLVRVIFSSCP